MFSATNPINRLIEPEDIDLAVSGSAVRSTAVTAIWYQSHFSRLGENVVGELEMKSDCLESLKQCSTQVFVYLDQTCGAVLSLSL